MKLLLFVRDLAVGGSQRQLAVLAAGLARCGHDVTVAVLYAGGALEALLEGSGVRLVTPGRSGRWDALGLARLRRMFLNERPISSMPSSRPRRRSRHCCCPAGSRRNLCSGCVRAACSPSITMH
jgi:hypothetical protein